MRNNHLIMIFHEYLSKHFDIELFAQREIQSKEILFYN